MNISSEKLNILKQDFTKLWLLCNQIEKLGFINKYLNDVSQESIAKSNMIRWLEYPTELGTLPDKIELLGDFIFNDTRIIAYKFSKEDFKIHGDLIGISGGFPLDKVSSISSGYTFSKFEVLSNDWEKQATELANFIASCWRERTNDVL